MRVGRSTWRGWPTPTGTAWWRRATWCVRARPAPRSRGCGAPALPLPNDAHHHTLDHDVALVHAQRRHGGIGGLEPDPAPWLAIEAFHGGARALHQGNHGLAVVGLVPLVDDDEIAVLDVLVDHRLAPHLQHVAAAAAGNQLVGHGNRIGPAHGLDRRAGRDETVQRQLGGAGLTARRYDLDAAALVVSAPDVPFALEARERARRAAAAPDRRPFAAALAGPAVGVIAEVKRRSPSAGAIREDLDPVTHAVAYERGGARAISVLTDELHFGGSLADLARVARVVALPVIRKDFILDELQLFEARAAGASAVLLIVRAPAPHALAALVRAAASLGLAVIAEIHAAAELASALAVRPAAVGVNSRDLATFSVDLALAERLVASIPRGVPVIAESGIEPRDDLARMAAAGADLRLGGTALARTPDPGAAVAALVGVAKRARRAGSRR